MKCKYCGTDIQNDWNYCPYCMTQQKEEIEKNIKKKKNAYYSSAHNTENQMEKKKYSIIVIISLIILVPINILLLVSRSGLSYKLPMKRLLMYGKYIFPLISVVLISNIFYRTNKKRLTNIIKYLFLISAALSFIFSLIAGFFLHYNY